MPALSSLVSLATQVQSQPGQFAVLLGSGVSTGAGLPTGWQIVKHLVQTAALAHGEPEPGPQTDDDIERWWAANGSGALGYSGVLEALAPTPAGRHALLEKFFEPAQDPEDSRGPSEAHRALARLAATGHVRVIITTNFDRLMEKALAEQNIDPQVISRPEAVAGMKPLVHAKVTVLKLHGDYKDLTTLNTPQELGDYPGQWRLVLEEVLRDYGLIIVGWSAIWDTALVHQLEQNPSRRYPMYWDARSSKGAEATQLLRHRDGIVLHASSADSLFTNLEASVAAIARLQEPPITTAIGVARLKKYVLDPIKRIDLHDLILAAVDPVTTAVADVDPSKVGSSDQIDDALSHLLEASRRLLTLLAHGSRHGSDAHPQLWAEVLDRLLAARRRPNGTFNTTADDLQHYPALLALYTMGATAIIAGDEQLFIDLNRDHRWEDPRRAVPGPVETILAPDWVLDAESIKTLPRWEGASWLYPPSHLLRSDLHPILAEFTADGSTTRTIDDLEFRQALLRCRTAEGETYALKGEYLGDPRWGERSALEAAIERFKATAHRAEPWPWEPVVAGDLDSALKQFDAHLLHK